MARKNYSIGDIVDFDDVLLSPRAIANWQATVAVAAPLLPPGVPVPDEQGLWLATGELEIFVEVCSMRISQKVPPGEWAWAP